MKQLILISTMLSSFQNDDSKNYIPDNTTAIKVAEAVWLPLYGDMIYQSQPFIAKLKGDTIWVVEGTYPKSTMETVDGDTMIYMRSGGVPYIELKRSNCEILNVSHSK
jgi:hypothetical protein